MGLLGLHRLLLGLLLGDHGGLADRAEDALFRFETVGQAVLDELAARADVVAALHVVVEHVGDGLDAARLLFFAVCGGKLHDLAERGGELERRHRLVWLGLRGVDGLLHGVDISFAGGNVDRFAADSERDVDLFAEHLAGFGFVFRHGDREGVEIDAFMVGGVPLDAIEIRFFLGDRGELLESALELGRILDLAPETSVILPGARCSAPAPSIWPDSSVAWKASMKSPSAALTAVAISSSGISSSSSIAFSACFRIVSMVIRIWSMFSLIVSGSAWLAKEKVTAASGWKKPAKFVFGVP